MSKLGVIMLGHHTKAVLWAIESKPTAFEYMMTGPLDTRPIEEIASGQPKVSQVDLLKMLVEASPKTLLVIRAYPDDLEHPDFQDRMLRWSEPFRAVSDRVVAHSINEYVPWTEDDAKRLSDYEIGFIERMSAEGLLPMCFCLPESHLGGPTLDQDGNFLNWGPLHLWQYMIPAVRRLSEAHGFLGFNEYDWPKWNSSRDRGYPWRLGHWELNLRLIAQWLGDWPMPRVGMGEGILDGKIYTSRLPRDHKLWNAPWGYRRSPKPGDNLPTPFDQILVGKSAEAYLNDFVAIEQDSYGDTRVAFFLGFAWAPQHHDWDPYDLSVMAGLLSRRLKESPPEYWEPKEDDMGDIIKSLDVSAFGGPIDEGQWKAAFNMGHRLAIVQAWGGIPGGRGKNKYCRGQLAGARKAGLMTAIYFHLPSDTTTQTHLFVPVVKEAAGSEYEHIKFVAIDVEGENPLHPTDPEARLANTIANIGDKPVIIYTSAYMWGKAGLGNVTAFSRYRLWDAHYDEEPDLDSNWTPYAGWEQRTIKQHTRNVSVAGISCDLNIADLGRLGLAPPAPYVEALERRIEELEIEVKDKTNAMTTIRNIADAQLKEQRDASG